MLLLFLLPGAFLLPPGARGAGNVSSWADPSCSWPPIVRPLEKDEPRVVPAVHVALGRPRAAMWWPRKPGGIVGGREAVPHSRPYMAFVTIKPWWAPAYHCGGFLVREDVVVTAAHCNVKGRVTVTLGAHNVRKREPGRQRIRARRRIPHPQYDERTTNNDIMLLQLRTRAVLTAWVQPIRLPAPWPAVPVGARCWVAGWGRMRFHPPESSAVLREVDLAVMADETCERSLTRPYYPASMLCAGDPRGKKASLKGDSGGPLVCAGVPQGIVSWGPANGISPEVYTRVSRFVPWIRRAMQRLAGPGTSPRA